MTDTNRDTTSSMFMRGLVLGAVTAILFAPRSGEQMRRDIKDRVDAVKDKLKDTSNKAVDKVDETVTDAQKKVQEVRNKTAGNNSNGSTR